MRQVSLALVGDDNPWCPVVGLDGSALGVESSVESAQTEALSACMKQLPERDRELLYMMFWDRKSDREIAKELDVVHGTVQYHRRRILAKLRRALDVA